MPGSYHVRNILQNIPPPRGIEGRGWQPLRLGSRVAAMVSESLPEDVQELLRAHVESYEHLAILLLVYRDPERHWSAADLAVALGIAEQLADSAVAALYSGGLLRIHSQAAATRYQYATAGANAAAVARLALEYSENPAGIAKFLSANAIGRLRGAALRAFADAFVLKKKDPDRG